MPLKLNHDEMPTVNLTSMIDILFLLIIFFMVGTRFSESESNIQINLPKVAPNGAMIQRPMSKTIVVTSDGAIVYEGQRVTAEQLTGLLAQAVQNYPDTSVQIRGDEKANLAMVFLCHNAITKSGAKFDGITGINQVPTTRR